MMLGTMTRSSQAQATCRFINDRLRPMADPFLSWLVGLDDSPSRLPWLVRISPESTDRLRCWRQRATEQPGIRLRFRFKKETCGITLLGANSMHSVHSGSPCTGRKVCHRHIYTFGANAGARRKRGLYGRRIRRSGWKRQNCCDPYSRYDVATQVNHAI